MSTEAAQSEHQAGPKYTIEIDGVEHPWDIPTIAVAQIRQLGSIPAGTQVLMIDEEENETTLAEDAIVELKPGKRYGRRIRFRRG